MEAGTMAPPKEELDREDIPHDDDMPADDGTKGGEEEPGEESVSGRPEPGVEIAGADQLTLIAGGEEPTGGSIRFVGGSIELKDRQFKKGDVVEFAIRARVRSVEFVDEHDDNTGNIVKTTRRHKATIIGAEELGE
jgi:hypothetical protein